MKSFVSALLVFAILAISIEFGLGVLLQHSSSRTCVKDTAPNKTYNSYALVNCNSATQFTFKQGRSDMKGSQKISSASTAKDIQSKCVYGNKGDEDNNNKGSVFAGDCDGRYPSCPYKQWTLQDSTSSPGKFQVTHSMDDPKWCWTKSGEQVGLVLCNEADIEQLFRKI